MQLPGRRMVLAALVAALSSSSWVATARAEPVPADVSKKPSKASKTTTTAPCTASSTSGAFYDLRPDTAVALAKGEKKPKTGAPSTDYAARGYDYGANFTLNICAPVVKPVEGVMGLDKDLWANVSAYYEVAGEIFSLGQQSSVLVSRGRELVLQYTGGSPCPDAGDIDGGKNRSKVGSGGGGGGSGSLYPRVPRPPHEDLGRDRTNYNVDERALSSSGSTIRRKSATFAFLCDRDPLESTAHISYVGTADECAYFFKIRSQHACAGAEPHKRGSVGPGGVFAIIAGVALLVYFIGGVVYQRTVAHARGWRQLPNYTLWAGIWTFIRDFAIILTSSCVRLVPYRRGYRALSTSPHGRGRSHDAENRLIDQLDEEWED